MAASGGSAPWLTRAICTLISVQVSGIVCRADSRAPIDRDGVVRCAEISAGDRRLACYDALAASLGLNPITNTPGQPRPTFHAPAANTAPAEVGDEKLFGLSKPLEPVARGPDSLRATVSRISENSVGNVSVVLDNDQTWQLIESNALLRPGDTVVIHRAALGSFIMATPSKRTYRVRRIR